MQIQVNNTSFDPVDPPVVMGNMLYSSTPIQTTLVIQFSHLAMNYHRQYKQYYMMPYSLLYNQTH